jgi:NADH-quinone oxidoreductase subunit F
MRKILVGTGTCGLSAGAGKVIAALRGNPGDFELSGTGCIGMCFVEPLVEVREGDIRRIYGEVTPETALRIAAGDYPEENLVYCSDGRGTHADFLLKQDRLVLRNCGYINPDSLEDYIATGGYEALEKAGEMSPGDIVALIRESGLRGRGGAGFPTGMKWSFAASAPGDRKYIVCNADEGDPGAFMDRSVIEGDPHAVIEGMLIAARAIGAGNGYIYCRAEYPLAVKRLQNAIAQAEERGYCRDVHLKVKMGAGAFVCGEETALFRSIEGKRGMPTFRPPYPAEKGLFARPTNNNNVETYACVPWIVRNGAAAFRSRGTEKSPGTKVFALAGKVKRGGLAEVSMGTPIRHLVFGIGGGIKGDRAFKAVQMGGPSGGCIPAHLADTPVDFESIPATGAIMGSGGMVVMDDTSCMVDIARFFLSFTCDESCGKCTFCRVGNRRLLETLERITAGEGREEDITFLETLGRQIIDGSLCGLGQTAPNPILTTLRYYRDEYEAHIRDGKCPAGSCRALITFTVDADACRGCTLCRKACPVGAVTGERGQVHLIEQSLCTKCGACFDACPFGAIVRE